MIDEGVDLKIIKVVPVYDYKNVAGGYFEVHFGSDKLSFIKLSFLPFLSDKVGKDKELFEYLKKAALDTTCSHAIFNLYDIGFPVDEWVHEYVERVKGNVSADLFNTLIQFYLHLKQFGNESTGSLE